MASPGNQHCAGCIGTLSFPIVTTKVQVFIESSDVPVKRFRAVYAPPRLDLILHF